MSTVMRSVASRVTLGLMPRRDIALAYSTRCMSEAVKDAPRDSRRRFARANTQGRSHYITALMEQMKRRSGRTAAQVDYDMLPPRVKLDIARRQANRDRALRISQRTSHIPKFYSEKFERKYFFREEDLDEEFTRGRGPGGQATNRRMQTAILKHVPTGIVVRHSRWPSLWLNRRAARELLHLRIEHKLVGRKSTLGLLKRSRSRRCRLQRSRNRRCTKVAARVALLESRVPNFLQVLRGEAGIPAHILESLRGTDSACDSGALLQHLFDEKCSMWCNLIRHSARNGHLEALLHVVFPLVPCAAWFDRHGGLAQHCLCDERVAYERLLRVRADEGVKKCLRRALGCVFEVLGLSMITARLRNPTTGEVADRLKVVRDAGNWCERFTVLWTDAKADGTTDSAAALQREKAALSAVIRLAVPHVYVSLMQVGFIEEASALKKFFVRETKEGAAWAKEGLALLQAASTEYLRVP